MRLRVWCLIPIYKSYHIPKNKLYTCPTLVENVVLQVPFLWCNSILGSLSFWLPQGPCCVWISLKFIIFYVLDSFIICIKTLCWLGNEFLFGGDNFLFLQICFHEKLRKRAFSTTKTITTFVRSKKLKENIDINTGYHVLGIPSTRQLSSRVP
jgi:hypothetical protein